MKLFLSQNASLTSEKIGEKNSSIVEVFASYVKAIQRNLVNVVRLSESDQKSLKFDEVSSSFHILVCFHLFDYIKYG